MVIDIIDLLSIKTIKDLQADFGAAHHSGEEVIIVIQLRGEEDLKHDMDNPPDRLHDSMLVENGGDRSPSTTALARSGSPTTQSFSRSMLFDYLWGSRSSYSDLSLSLLLLMMLGKLWKLVNQKLKSKVW